MGNVRWGSFGLWGQIVWRLRRLLGGRGYQRFFGLNRCILIWNWLFGLRIGHRKRWVALGDLRRLRRRKAGLRLGLCFALQQLKSELSRGLGRRRGSRRRLGKDLVRIRSIDRFFAVHLWGWLFGRLVPVWRRLLPGALEKAWRYQRALSILMLQCAKYLERGLKRSRRKRRLGRKRWMRRWNRRRLPQGEVGGDLWLMCQGRWGVGGGCRGRQL